jgi:Ca2+-binding RTX toxin-like protein
MSARGYARVALLGTLTAFIFPAATGSVANAAPSCAEGPQTVGETIYGTPCNDTIHVPRDIATVYGEGGDDAIYGGRGNDTLYGGEGNDRLYGGIGDDHPRGGPGNDLLSGGFGADSLDGEAGNDLVRGDATVDAIGDSGGGTDTLSFATGATPGFPNEGPFFAYTRFPSDGAEDGQGRGVYIELGNKFANDGLAPAGGGVDRPLNAASFEAFEVVIGTPFSDFIVGTTGAQTIYGGGGADVILGKGGGDQVLGGADGDYCEEGAGIATGSCEFSGGEKEVEPQAAAQVGAGMMAPATGPAPALYLTGSTGPDDVTARYEPGAVVFELGAGSSFDPGAVAEGGCTPLAANKASCSISQTPDSVVIAGLGGDDRLAAPGFPESTSVILLGGEGGDQLAGGAAEDAAIDGPGNDFVDAGGDDDAVPNNQGVDNLLAGPGDDLFISDAVCEGDRLDGGEGSDNANWANFSQPVTLDLGNGVGGLIGAGGQAACPSGTLSSLQELEDIEATKGGDVLIGDSGSNQLLGRPGADSYFAAGGDDSILANSGDSDPTIDCGDGFDTAQIDIPTHNATEDFEDAPPVNCEAVHERAPNSFRPPDTPPAPEASASAAPPPPTSKPPKGKQPQRQDRTAPRTRIVHRPAAILFAARPRRLVAFSFAANEAGSTFRCKLDRAPFRPCRSPRAYRLDRGGTRSASTRPTRPATATARRRWSSSESGAAEPPSRRAQRPLEPKPPSPRAESASASTSTGSARAMGTIASWAMRSPGATRKVSAGSVLSSSTRTSPR